MGIIRLILALAVVVEHSTSLFGIHSVGGQIAVQTFYIISGFYMSLILNEKYIKKNNSYKLFISNRFMRLFPIYWVVLLLTIFLSLIIYALSGGKDAGQFALYITYAKNMDITSLIFLIFTNIFLFFQDIVMFLGLNTSTGHLFFTPNFRNTSPQLWNFLFIHQAWTIGVELTFYLFAPFIVRRRPKFIMILIVLSAFLRFILYKSGMHNDPWTYRFFPTELVFFLFGNISYRIYVKIREMKIKNLHLDVLLGITFIFTLIYDWIPVPHKAYLYFLFMFLAIPFIFLRTKGWKKDTFIGELSYPVYISHLFILSLITIFNIPLIGGQGFTLSILSIVFSILLNLVIAKKVEAYRQKRVTNFSNIQLVDKAQFANKPA
jgi:peptidoglycan/LPS O-acetylase OafA/YrhL